MVLIAPELPGTPLFTPAGGGSGRQAAGTMREGPRMAARGEEAPAVSLSRRQLRTLRGIERNLACSDPALDAWFVSFAGLLQGRDMPTAERLPRWPSRLLWRLWRGPSVSELVAAWCAENWNNP